jgi:hypothetical protein
VRTDDLVNFWRPPRPPTGDITAALPRFAVLTADGETVATGLLYRPAMELRARVGGALSATGPAGAP